MSFGDTSKHSICVHSHELTLSSFNTAQRIWGHCVVKLWWLELSSAFHVWCSVQKPKLSSLSMCFYNGYVIAWAWTRVHIYKVGLKTQRAQGAFSGPFCGKYLLCAVWGSRQKCVFCLLVKGLVGIKWLRNVSVAIKRGIMFILTFSTLVTPEHRVTWAWICNDGYVKLSHVRTGFLGKCWCACVDLSVPAAMQCQIFTASLSFLHA